jgi:hypothetical protein
MVTAIGERTFANFTRLTSVTIPDMAVSIGEAAIYACTSLTSVTIPNSAATIGYVAFYGCSSLTSVTSLNPTPTAVDNENAFDAATYTSTLYVSEGSEEAYLLRLFGRVLMVLY